MRALAEAVHRLCGENHWMQRWEPYPTLENARNDLSALEHQVEKKGLDEFRGLCAKHGLRSFLPTAQASHTDLVVTLPPSWVPSWLARRREWRIQAKTLIRQSNTGYNCKLSIAGGKKYLGHRTWVPYPAKAFDVLLLVWFDSAGIAHWWIIPERELRDRGYVGDPGRKSITVHMDANPPTGWKSDKFFHECYEGTDPDLAAIFK